MEIILRKKRRLLAFGMPVPIWMVMYKCILISLLVSTYLVALGATFLQKVLSDLSVRVSQVQTKTQE